MKRLCVWWSLFLALFVLLSLVDSSDAKRHHAHKLLRRSQLAQKTNRVAVKDFVSPAVGLEIEFAASNMGNYVGCWNNSTRKFQDLVGNHSATNEVSVGYDTPVFTSAVSEKYKLPYLKSVLEHCKWDSTKKFCITEVVSSPISLAVSNEHIALHRAYAAYMHTLAKVWDDGDYESLPLNRVIDAEKMAAAYNGFIKTYFKAAFDSSVATTLIAKYSLSVVQPGTKFGDDCKWKFKPIRTRIAANVQVNYGVPLATIAGPEVNVEKGAEVAGTNLADLFTSPASKTYFVESRALADRVLTEVWGSGKPEKPNYVKGVLTIFFFYAFHNTRDENDLTKDTYDQLIKTSPVSLLRSDGLPAADKSKIVLNTKEPSGEVSPIRAAVRKVFSQSTMIVSKPKLNDTSKVQAFIDAQFDSVFVADSSTRSSSSNIGAIDKPIPVQDYMIRGKNTAQGVVVESRKTNSDLNKGFLPSEDTKESTLKTYDEILQRRLHQLAVLARVVHAN